MKKLITILTMALMLIFASTAMATDVCLEWDANTTDGDLAGYRVFVKAEGSEYDYNSPWCDCTSTSCSVPLPDGVTFYLVARCYDTEGLESVDSNEISWFNDFPWVNTPPSTVDLRIVPCVP